MDALNINAAHTRCTHICSSRVISHFTHAYLCMYLRRLKNYGMWCDPTLDVHGQTPARSQQLWLTMVKWFLFRNVLSAYMLPNVQVGRQLLFFALANPNPFIGTGAGALSQAFPSKPQSRRKWRRRSIVENRGWVHMWTAKPSRNRICQGSQGDLYLFHIVKVTHTYVYILII